MTTRRSRKSGSTRSSVAHYSDVEDVSTNLSSQQIWDTLTYLLYLTLNPLAEQTTLSDDLLFSIIASSTDQRRKVSAQDADVCFDYCYRLLFRDPSTILVGLLRGIGVERTVFTHFITEYLQGSYNPIWMDFDKDTPAYTPATLRQYVSDFYDLYASFRSKVTDRFRKLGMSQAAKNQWQRNMFGLTSDLGDNEQNFYLAIIRAVDKFYPGRGTLANYVMLWLQNAAGSAYTLYTGEAFTLTRPVRKLIHDGTLAVNNKAYSLESAIDIADQQSQGGFSQLESSRLLNVIAQLQSVPEYSMVFLLSGYPLMPSKEVINEILPLLEGTELTLEDVLPSIDLGELPSIHLPTRTSRKNTPEQRRRKEHMRSRRKERKRK